VSPSYPPQNRSRALCAGRVVPAEIDLLDRRMLRSSIMIRLRFDCPWLLLSLVEVDD
jgi:hypothetical protein